jgi:3-hydroxybutyryl-CoA dehydrogenase
MDIEVVGVIGAGQMGTGIAQVCAASGYKVLLHDLSAERIEAGRAAIRTSLGRQAARGSLGIEAAEAAAARIKPAEGVNALSASDLIIEAATENETTKLSILKGVAAQLKPEAILASNTSSISITRLAAVTDRPERFIGLHFMNPVPAMKLVEVIRGIATCPDVYDTVTAFAGTLGKSTTESQDYPGFLVNRVLIPMINEAVYAVYEGVGDVVAVDTALKLGANHPMGPLELADFIGLDTVLSIMSVMHEGLGDSKYRPCPLLIKYVAAGWLGRKSGRGFYDYRGDSPVPTR